MSNIKDVARLAGVSISTVSYVLNNSHRVTDETRSKVLEAVKRLNYRPDYTARNLKLRKTKTIGIFLKNLIGHYYNDIVKGITDQIKQKNYESSMIVIFDEFIDDVIESHFVERRIDGAIILAASFLSEKFLKSIDKWNIPVVIFDRDPLKNFNSRFIKTININNFQGAFKAVSHLIEQGFSKIGYISGHDHSYDNRQRFNGYLFALEKNKINYNPEWTIHANYYEGTAYKEIRNFVNNNNLPEAFFCANDQMAIGAMRALKDHNIRVPEDVAIVGFDDIDLSSYIEPSLTTIFYDRYDMGKKAVNEVVNMIDGHIDKKNINIETKVVIRNSTLKLAN